jgi:sucrose phosphorylase
VKSRTETANFYQQVRYSSQLKPHEPITDPRLSSLCAGAIGSVHLLPVYRSSGDGGFAPICYTEVDPDLGTWDDVKEVADRYDLCVEFMVNHISPQSDQFQDFLAKGDDSEFAEMFIDWDKFWPEGKNC